MDTAAVADLAKPILCVDTCSLLDIMRDPTRETARAHERQAEINVVELAEAGELVLLMAQQVETEFHAHDQRVQDEARTKLRKLSEQVARVNDITAIFGSSQVLETAHFEGCVPMARAVVQRWLDQLHTIAPGADIHSRAFARVNANRAPAKRGKESSKDCLVYETYLEAVAKIRAAGTASKIVFVSSNIADYCENRSIVKSEIASEFGALSIEYAPNMAAAKYALGFTTQSTFGSP